MNDFSYNNDALRTWETTRDHTEDWRRELDRDSPAKPRKIRMCGRRFDWKELLRRVLLLAACAFTFASIGSYLTLTIKAVILRNEFRMDRLRINAAIQSSGTGSCTIECGGEVLPLTGETLNYFFTYLNNPRTTPYNRKHVPQTKQTIILRLYGGTLFLTGVDGGATNVCWETDSGKHYYSVRNPLRSFAQLRLFFDSLRENADTG